MYFTARINSFIKSKDDGVETAFKAFKANADLTYVDLNYPEHFNGYTVSQMKSLLAEYDLKVHGLAMRFRGFINGEFGNANDELSKKALQLTCDAVDACAELGGENVTVWLGFDGFEYNFQVDYVKTFNKIVKCYQDACAYAEPKGVKLSIEYKPYEPRAFSMIDSFGMAMHVIDKVGFDNLGLTLDYCHMLMKKENPAYGLALALEAGKVHAVHLNDGYGRNDDGMMIGSCSLMTTLEFVYYLKKYKYDGMVYFDTFPIREDPAKEAALNIAMFKKLCGIVDRIGLDEMSKLIDKNDANAVMEMFIQI